MERTSECVVPGRLLHESARPRLLFKMLCELCANLFLGWVVRFELPGKGNNMLIDFTVFLPCHPLDLFSLLFFFLLPDAGD